MTKLIIVSNLTILPIGGKLDLGERQLSKFTIGDVKDKVAEMCRDITIDSQNLWWRGYSLDNNKLPIIKACVGLNSDEFLQPNTSALTLFLTMSKPVTKENIIPAINESKNITTISVNSLEKLEYYRNEINRLSTKKIEEVRKSDIFKSRDKYGYMQFGTA